MNIDKSNATPSKRFATNEVHNLLVAGDNWLWQTGKPADQIIRLTRVSKRQFPYDKGMCKHLVLRQQISKGRVALSEMIDPD